MDKKVWRYKYAWFRVYFPDNTIHTYIGSNYSNEVLHGTFYGNNKIWTYNKYPTKHDYKFIGYDGKNHVYIDKRLRLKLQ